MTPARGASPATHTSTSASSRSRRSRGRRHPPWRGRAAGGPLHLLATALDRHPRRADARRPRVARHLQRRARPHRARRGRPRAVAPLRRTLRSRSLPRSDRSQAPRPAAGPLRGSSACSRRPGTPPALRARAAPSCSARALPRGSQLPPAAARRSTGSRSGESPTARKQPSARGACGARDEHERAEPVRGDDPRRGDRVLPRVAAPGSTTIAAAARPSARATRAAAPPRTAARRRAAGEHEVGARPPRQSSSPRSTRSADASSSVSPLAREASASTCPDDRGVVDDAFPRRPRLGEPLDAVRDGREREEDEHGHRREPERPRRARAPVEERGAEEQQERPGEGRDGEIERLSRGRGTRPSVAARRCVRQAPRPARAPRRPRALALGPRGHEGCNSSAGTRSTEEHRCPAFTCPFFPSPFSPCSRRRPPARSRARDASHPAGGPARGCGGAGKAGRRGRAGARGRARAVRRGRQGVRP